MKKEEALKIYTDFQQKLKADPTLSIPGSYNHAVTVLKEEGFEFPSLEEKAEEVVVTETEEE